VRHFIDCTAQCPDQLHGLGIIGFTHTHQGIVSSSRPNLKPR
jgi:hypothetical protein